LQKNDKLTEEIAYAANVARISGKSEIM